MHSELIFLWLKHFNNSENKQVFVILCNSLQVQLTDKSCLQDVTQK